MVAATMARRDSAVAPGARFGLRHCRRAGETIASRTRVYGGDAFRHHLLRSHHKPAGHRCYPLRTHARSAKVGLEGPRAELTDAPGFAGPVTRIAHQQQSLSLSGPILPPPPPKSLPVPIVNFKKMQRLLGRALDVSRSFRRVKHRPASAPFSTCHNAGIG